MADRSNREDGEVARDAHAIEPAWLEFGAHVQQAGLTLYQECVATLVKGGFNAGRWPILLHLKREPGPVRQNDLAAALGADRLTLGNILQDSEAAGFILRDYDPNDRRIKLVRLTAAGRARAVEVEAVIARICDRFASRISAADAAVCMRVLREICDAIKE
ncbi:MAG TPA: MarR family winged helix-turn-helix transcriptional regulator [Alphaproteobacteria bacterium]|nr:MarR family winged helix-turn-helix transcriptional regulator [Alphaproteobacteria bacterium]